MDISDVFRMGRMARHGALASETGDPYVIGYVIFMIVFVMVLRFWRNRK